MALLIALNAVPGVSQSFSPSVSPGTGVVAAAVPSWCLQLPSACFRLLLQPSTPGDIPISGWRITYLPPVT